MSRTHYHFVGIGGAGMSALARIFAKQGFEVSGSDMSDSATLRNLTDEYDVTTYVGHEALHVEGADVVITTAAVKGSNAEVDRAAELSLPIITRAECLGQLMSGYAKSVAVSGTHGKTTTSGMIAQMLTVAHLDPTAVIGGDVPAWSSNARIGGSDVFVAEACEAYGSFFELHPAISVITNIELDHLDFYAGIDAIRDAFRRLLNQTSYYAVMCVDDPESKLLASEVTDNIATYGISESASIRAVDIELRQTSSYTVEILGNRLGRIELSVPGLHNVVNSLAAVAVGNLLDVPFEDIAAGLKAFTGTGRRFELLAATQDDILVVDDYAHHPTEIKATLAAAATSYPDRRIVAVFQPHLPSRTRDFMDEFAASFSQADVIVLTGIYLSREKALEGIDGAALADKIERFYGSENVHYVENKLDLPDLLNKVCKPQDLLITLGAGDIRNAAVSFLKMHNDVERAANV